MNIHAESERFGHVNLPQRESWRSEAAYRKGLARRTGYSDAAVEAGAAELAAGARRGGAAGLAAGARRGGAARAEAAASMAAQWERGAGIANSRGCGRGSTGEKEGLTTTGGMRRPGGGRAAEATGLAAAGARQAGAAGLAAGAPAGRRLMGGGDGRRTPTMGGDRQPKEATERCALTRAGRFRMPRKTVRSGANRCTA